MSTSGRVMELSAAFVATTTCQYSYIVIVSITMIMSVIIVVIIIIVTTHIVISMCILFIEKL